MNGSQWLVLILQGSIMLTVLGLGLMATWHDATYLLRRPKLLIPAVLSMSVAMPVIAAVLATHFALPLEVKVALVALAVSPVPPIIQQKQITAGGPKEYVVGLLVAMSVLAIVLVPLTVGILNQVFGRAGVIGPATVAKIMLTTVLAPLLAGLLIRGRWRQSEKAARPIMAVASILLAVMVVVLLYGLWPVIRSYIGNGVVLMLLVMAVIGLAVGHVFGGPVAGDRTALAMSTASRHPAVALAIATSGVIHEQKPALAIILLYLLIATVVTIPYQRWRTAATGAPANEGGGA